MNPASAAQKRKIYSLARESGIDGLSGKDVRSLNPKKDSMSYAQKRYLSSLAIKLGWTEDDGSLNEKRLNGFCRSQYNVLYWTCLTRSKACKAIEALKKMVEREVSA